MEQMDKILERLAVVEEQLRTAARERHVLTDRVMSLEKHYMKIERMMWFVIAGLALNKVPVGELLVIVKGFLL